MHVDSCSAVYQYYLLNIIILNLSNKKYGGES